MARLEKKIIKLRTKNPLWSVAKIAEKLGCSRVYVYKILEKANLPKPPRKKKIRLCEWCKKESTALVHKGRCSYEYYRIEVTCSFCKVRFRRTRNQLKHGYRRGYENIYCSQRCYNKGRIDKSKSWAK